MANSFCSILRLESRLHGICCQQSFPWHKEITEPDKGGKLRHNSREVNPPQYPSKTGQDPPATSLPTLSSPFHGRQLLAPCLSICPPAGALCPCAALAQHFPKCSRLAWLAAAETGGWLQD